MWQHPRQRSEIAGSRLSTPEWSIWAIGPVSLGPPTARAERDRRRYVPIRRLIGGGGLHGRDGLCGGAGRGGEASRVVAVTAIAIVVVVQNNL